MSKTSNKAKRAKFNAAKACMSRDNYVNYKGATPNNTPKYDTKGIQKCMWLNPHIPNFFN